MKLIIAGSRNVNLSVNELDEWMQEIWRHPLPDEIVCGMAPGVDLVGKAWAASCGIPIQEFPANWDLHKKQAGYIRNSDMGNYANELIAFWDGKSKGTKHMIQIMLNLNKPFQVILINKFDKNQ